MLSHPDPQVQYIFATLESQRDNLMVENGNLAAQIKKLEAQIPHPIVPLDTEEEQPAELPIN